MTVTLDYPSRLPLPLLPGYEREKIENMLRTPMEAGLARQRRRTLDNPAEIDVVFEFDAIEAALFEGWKQNRADGGAAWFNVPLLGAVGLTNHVARIKDGKVRERARPGGHWTLMATLEIREPPSLSSADLDLLMDEDFASLWAGIASFHATVGAPPLWASGNDLYLIYGENSDLLLANVAAFHALALGPWWQSGDDLYFDQVYGEDTAFLFGRVSALHAALSPSLLWTN